MSQGKVNLGSRGARLVWLEETVIALSGFNRFKFNSTLIVQDIY